jgi:hypothetical protein
MATRSIRLVAYLVLLLALGCGVSLAASGPAIVAGGIHPPSNFCLTPSRFDHRGTINASYHSRFAQLLHCVCCGKDENGHCNHQCCD